MISVEEHAFAPARYLGGMAKQGAPALDFPQHLAALRKQQRPTRQALAERVGGHVVQLRQCRSEHSPFSAAEFPFCEFLIEICYRVLQLFSVFREVLIAFLVVVRARVIQIVQSRRIGEPQWIVKRIGVSDSTIAAPTVVRSSIADPGW